MTESAPTSVPMHFLIGCSFKSAAIADHFRAIARWLVDRGHRVTLATWGEDCRSHFGVEGSELVKFPSARPTRWRDVWFAYRLMRAGQVDCVVANFGSVNALVTAAVMARVRTRVVWHHTLLPQILADRGGLDVRLAVQMARRRIVFALATHAAGNSRKAVEELACVWLLPERKIRMFWYAIPDPLAEAQGAFHRHNGRILCPGRLHPSKGQDVLLRALPAVAQVLPEVEVVFAGDGPERARLERLAGSLGVQGRVHFAGALERSVLLGYMGEAGICVVPSLDEAFGLVNIEAMGMGTPVVASRVGGIPEIVRDGVDGLLFERGDAGALAGCLIRLLKDGGLREEMGRNARQRFLEEFESGKAAGRQGEWLEGLVREARR